MQRRVERALVAKVGALVFAVALGLPATLSPRSAQASVMIASLVDDALVPIVVASLVLDRMELHPAELHPTSTEAAVAIAASVTDDPVEVAPARAPRAAAPPSPALAPVAVAPPEPEPLVLDGVVIASWYGPGFFGNRTACGQTYTPEMMGVAHRLLPCGSQIKLTSPAGVTVVVPVIDRGPYVAGRSLDLSNATKLALRCSDLCQVRMTVLD